MKRLSFLVVLVVSFLFYLLYLERNLDQNIGEPKPEGELADPLNELSDSSWMDGSLRSTASDKTNKKPPSSSQAGSATPTTASSTPDHQSDQNHKLETVYSLKEKLHSDNPKEQSDALFKLSKLGAQALDALPEIMNFLESKDAKLQELAAFTLAKMGPEAVFEAQAKLVELLKSTDSIVRENAIFALGQGNQLSRDVVLQMGATLDDPVKQVKVSGIYALSRLGKEAAPALPKVQKFLSSPDPQMREEAAFTIGRMREEAAEAQGALEELSQKDPDEKVRDAAANALRLIRGGVMNQEIKNSKEFTDEN